DEKAAHIAALVAALRYRRKGLGKPLTKIGHFTGLVDFGSYALSLCTDSVGTKVLVAKEMRRWDTIGIDCVAMNVNDMICIGAEPLAFVDYVAISAYDQEVARQIGVGLNRGAELANVSIIGGEVAVVPELIREIDLAGTCFGAVLKTKVIDGRGVRNLVRLKSNVEFRISEPLEVPAVFRALQMLGGIAPSEMYQTFNMGMGFAIVAPEDAAKPIIRSLRPEVNARVVGSVERGRGVTVPELGLSWTTY